MQFIIPILIAVMVSAIAVMCFSRLSGVDYGRLNPLVHWAVLVINLALALMLIYKHPYSFYYYALFLLINILFMSAVIDYQTKEIPNNLLLAMLVLGAVSMFFIPGVVYYNPLISAMVLGLIMFLLSKKTRAELGMGDVKLITCLALFFGFQKIIAIIFLSLILGLVFGLFIIVKNKQNIKTEIAFVPFVFMSTLIYVLI